MSPWTLGHCGKAVAAVSATLLLGVVAGCGSSDDSEPRAAEDGGLTKVTVGMGPSFNMLDALVAMGAGYFEEEGLDVELTEIWSSADMVTAAANQDVDISVPGAGGLIAGIAANQDLVALAVASSRPTHCVTVGTETLEKFAADGVTSESPIADRVAALEGITIATTEMGGTTERLVRSMFNDFGVSPDATDQFTAIADGAAQVTALKADRVPIIAATLPPGVIPQVDGTGECFISFGTDEIPSLSNSTYGVHITSPQFAEANPEILKSWVTALAKADDLINSDQAAVADAVSEFFPDLDKEAMRLSIEFVASAYVSGPKPDEEGFANAVRDHDALAENPAGDLALGDVFMLELTENL